MAVDTPSLVQLGEVARVSDDRQRRILRLGALGQFRPGPQIEPPAPQAVVGGANDARDKLHVSTDGPRTGIRWRYTV